MNVSVQVSKITLQVVRVASLLMAFLSFSVVAYVGMVIGFDLPKWRMSGDTNSMMIYFISFGFATSIGIASIHISDSTSNLLKPALESNDEDDAI